MVLIKDFIGSKNTRTVLLGSFLLINAISLLVLKQKTHIRSSLNGLDDNNDDQIILRSGFSKKEIDSFDSLTFNQLMNYFK